MKATILLSFIVLSGVAGGNHQSPAFNNNINKTMTAMNSQLKNKEIVRAIYEQCLNKREYASLKNYIAEDYTGPLGEKGATGFEETIRGIITGFPDIQWTIEDMVAEGDKVAVRWSWMGTHTGAFRTFAPTGKRVTNKAMVIYHFRDDKIVSVWMESDRLGFLQQMGVVPENVGAPVKKN